jgi:hypothetical protein
MLDCVNIKVKGNLMNKLIKKLYIPAAVFILSLVITNCELDDMKNKYLERPKFDFQKTYLLRQAPMYFSIYYSVWKNIPVDVMEFNSIKDIKEGKVFDAHKRIELVKNSYVIEDNVNKKKYLLKQESPSDELLNFSISSDNKMLASIKQIEKKDILNFDFTYKERNFQIIGEMRKSGDTVYSFVYEIKDKDKNRMIGKIFKEYKNFLNEYEIYINREFGFVEDPIFINLGIFIDHVLRINGYQYR